MTNETSPRPWKIVGTYRDIIVGADGVKVCELYGGLGTQQENATLIVDAVNHIEETKRLSVKLYDPIRRAEAERDRLRDIVRRTVETLEQVYKHADMTDYLRADVAEMQREARAAIGEGQP